MNKKLQISVRWFCNEYEFRPENLGKMKELWNTRLIEHDLRQWSKGKPYNTEMSNDLSLTWVTLGFNWPNEEGKSKADSIIFTLPRR